MDQKNWILVGVAGLALVAVIALLFSPAAGSAGVEEASPERIAELIGSGVRVIDVRTPEEYAASHLPGAENVPMDVLPDVATDWDRSEPIIIYCTTGQRSSFVIDYLAEEGFESVHHFTRGIVAWNGDLERGVEIAEMPPDVSPAGTPVVLEFFTDW